VRSRTERGFTTIEALVSFVILLLMLAAVLEVYSQSRQVFTRGERKADLQQNARFAIAQIARQVRMAGYFPENLTTPPAIPTLLDPIRIATDSALVVYGDIDGTGTSGVVMFCLDGDVVRRTSGPPTSAPAYTCSSGQVLAQGVTDLRFAYYDAANTPIPNPPTAPFQLDAQGPGSAPDMTTPTQRRLVQRVLITLTTRGFTVGMGPQNFTLTSDVEIRNVQ
jgi:type II secretory pathway pseudopilin PulG